MVEYGVLRFAIEFIRKTPKTTLGMSHGQLFAIISVVLGAGFLLIYRNTQAKKTTQAAEEE
jgi:prolipoprotein diacylglyceryltransferase